MQDYIPKIMWCISYCLAISHLSPCIVQHNFPSCIFWLWLNDFINCFHDHPHVLLKEMGLMNKYIVYNLPLSFTYPELTQVLNCIRLLVKSNPKQVCLWRCILYVHTSFQWWKHFPVFFFFDFSVLLKWMFYWQTSKENKICINSWGPGETFLMLACILCLRSACQISHKFVVCITNDLLCLKYH